MPSRNTVGGARFGRNGCRNFDKRQLGKNEYTITLLCDGANPVAAFFFYVALEYSA
jgi:hypothetical protein